MGNWHCVPSGCAEVVYQEYLPPVVRWQYPNENWREIKADDYVIKSSGQIPKISYQIAVTTRRSFISPSRFIQNITRVRSGTGPIIDVFLRRSFSPEGYHQTYLVRIDTALDGSERTFEEFIAGDNIREDLQSIVITRTDNQPDTTCTFIVTKNSQIVHKETREVCPEVEKIPCRLSSETKKIEINKLPYLEKVEVVPYEYATYRQPGLPLPPLTQANDIPDECLNIYNNAIFVIPPDPDALKNPNATPFDSFITQICSAPGCLPPEYQVLCDSCGCENCPPGTRAVTCGNSICCYGSDGKAVKEIAISDYCGGGDCE